MTEDPEELQVMFDSKVVLWRPSIHSSYAKTKVVCKRCSSTVNDKERQEWSIGESILHLSDSTTHLSLVRTDKNDCGINVADSTSLASRTGYSLIKSGFHGPNGLNPKVSYRMYQTYLMPRMLYSLEILDLKQ